MKGPIHTYGPHKGLPLVDENGDSFRDNLPIPGMRLMTDDEIRSFIAHHHWKFAKTMPKFPHEYTLRKNCRDDEEFVRFASHIRACGTHRNFFQTPLIYFAFEGWEYWTMGFDIRELTILINRARK